MAIFVALGANQIAEFRAQKLNPPQTFKSACLELQNSGIEIVRASHIWQSPAWPDPSAQPAYNNAVIKLKTDIKPLELLNILKRIEKQFGRTPSARNAPRPLDLDILDYNGQCIETKRLVLPHPRMLNRGFVLVPLAQIAPNWRDPQKSREIYDWIARLPLKDVSPMKRLGAFI